ncbi:hypothetical protein MMC11_005437 [Xylographa trunciseda]|nr:hypothetical protein [Xylographa trunciseda]
MASINRPTRRLIICVDGTWYSPDGSTGSGNNSNVFRISAVVNKGHVRDQSGKEFEQIVRYITGIGFFEKGVQKLNTAITGHGCEEQIKQITKLCCELLDQPDDELWLYGFSRGAYVVRAVAGLFHHMRVLSSDSLQRFDDAYAETLRLYQARDRLSRAGRLFDYLTSKTRKPPVIKFLGLFDTVKAVTDNVHDISLVESIQNCRQALALNESRSFMVPELLMVALDANQINQHSFIQAWFLGAHADLGGANQHDGFSLYPLQWMLLESRKCGLVLGFQPPENMKNIIENPLQLVFPGIQAPEIESEETGTLWWQISYQNGIQVKLRDLSSTHNKNSEREADASSHRLLLNEGSTIKKRVPRQPFKDGQLDGYCMNGAHGTIIHPSVYLLLDVYTWIAQHSRIKPFVSIVSEFRAKSMLEGQEIPWIVDRELAQRLARSEVNAFRILVLGKTGVGKSTLINKVFGTKLTAESEDLKQGVHEIEHAFQSNDHPGLLIHDSRGYQSGTDEEFNLIRSFVMKRSSKAKPKERLHAIWFCLDLNVSRIEEGDKKVFSILATHAVKVPVLVVGTKKDIVWKYHFADALTEGEMSRSDAGKAADNAVGKKQEVIKEELGRSTGSQEVGYVSVAQSDVQSVKQLLRQTLAGLDDEQVRLYVVAAQVIDLDRKIDAAITESLGFGRRAVKIAMTPLPLTGAIATPSISRKLCQSVLQCFGFPNVTDRGVSEIMSTLVWGNLRQFMIQSSISFVGGGALVLGLAVATMGPGGLLVTGVVSLLAAARTARVVLKCACDVILIMERAFLNAKQDARKFVTENEIRSAAEQYVKAKVNGDTKTLQQQVHTEIDELVKLSRMNVGLKFGKLRVEMEGIIERNRLQKRTKQTEVNGMPELEGSAEKEEEIVDTRPLLVDTASFSKETSTDDDRSYRDSMSSWPETLSSTTTVNSTADSSEDVGTFKGRLLPTRSLAVRSANRPLSLQRRERARKAVPDTTMTNKF